MLFRSDEGKLYASPHIYAANPLTGTPFASEGQALFALLRKKTPKDEDFEAAINAIQEKAAAAGVADVLVPSVDALMTAICRAGAKSLSHVLSCIEKGKAHLKPLADKSEVAQRQIVASVFEYWSDHPGVAVRIVNILLNYGVVTPRGVVQWALGDYLGAGEALSKAFIFEMVCNTVAKVARRNREIADARLRKGLLQEQMDYTDSALADDRANARDLFNYITEAVHRAAEVAEIGRAHV